MFGRTQVGGEGAVSGPASEGDWAIAPRKPPRRLRSSSRPWALYSQPGGRPRVTQVMPCWAARSAMEVSVLSLSPFTPAEFVKPAATLSRQPMSAQTLALASANVWKAADWLPM
nr:hypothetical protein GCM10020093_012070 [Planobispora longispora]